MINLQTKLDIVDLIKTDLSNSILRGTVWDLISIEDENETLFMRVWKPLLVQKGHLIAVGLDSYIQHDRFQKWFEDNFFDRGKD